MHIAGPIALLSAIGGVQSLVIAPRDLQSILGVLGNVQTDIDGLDEAVKGWTEDPAPVLEASNKLVATIKTGTGTISESENLTLSESIKLIKPVDELTAHAQTLVDDLKGKKDIVQNNSLCDIVRDQISGMGEQSQGMIDATVSKVPESAQDIAKQKAQAIIDVLNDAKEAFSAENCVDA